MADIFISYSSAERQVTEALASDLEAAGYSVWWDTSLVPGDVFKDVIEEKIAASKAAIVIWTKASIKSKWVYSEATRADAQGKLVPLRAADITSADIPMPFGATHAEIVDNRAGVVTALERLGVRPAPKPAPQPVLPPEALPTEADEQRRARMARMKAEEEHWDLIKRSRDAAALRSFLAHYPDGTFAATARARLAQVEGAGGNRTGLIGAAAAVVVAVVGAGGWWALQPASAPPELAKPTEAALRQAAAIKKADDDLQKRQRADADAKATALAAAEAAAAAMRQAEAAKKQAEDDARRLAKERADADARLKAEAEVARIAKERADAEAALKQAREAAAAATRQAAEAEKARKQAEDKARFLAKERDMAEARRKAELEAAKPAPVHDCDRLAAAPSRRPKLTEGVEFSLVRPEAVAACERAVREFPNEVRFWQQLGRAFYKAKMFDKARPLYEMTAAAGDALGMNDLGFLYDMGHGVRQEAKTAMSWYEKAAAAGNSVAMANIGSHYAEGKSVEKDLLKARDWYEKSAAAGDARGAAGLGSLYAQGGAGVPQDATKSREWYEKAAAAGSSGAMARLGVLFEEGKDYAKAREWYGKAAVAGDGGGMNNLAILWEEGKGGSTDYSRSAKLLLQAARADEKAALDSLRGDMSAWTSQTRRELKRELSRLGHYKGTVDDKWNDAARAAFERYLKAQ